MANIYTTGFESNNLADFTSEDFITIQTGVVHSGTYALKADNGGGNGYSDLNQAFTPSGSKIFFRAYIQITQDIDVDDYILWLYRNNNPIFGIQLTTTRKLQLKRSSDPGNPQIGSDSAALSLNTWYYLEVQVDNTTNTAMFAEAKINGTAFASGTLNESALASSGGFNFMTIGIGFNTGSISTGIIYFDDIVINDETTGTNNTYPGALAGTTTSTSTTTTSTSTSTTTTSTSTSTSTSTTTTSTSTSITTSTSTSTTTTSTSTSTSTTTTSTSTSTSTTTTSTSTSTSTSTTHTTTSTSTSTSTSTTTSTSTSTTTTSTSTSTSSSTSSSSSTSTSTTTTWPYHFTVESAIN